jgi:hypothetical protein
LPNGTYHYMGHRMTLILQENYCFFFLDCKFFSCQSFFFPKFWEIFSNPERLNKMFNRYKVNTFFNFSKYCLKTMRSSFLRKTIECICKLVRLCYFSETNLLTFILNQVTLKIHSYSSRILLIIQRFENIWNNVSPSNFQTL